MNHDTHTSQASVDAVAEEAAAASKRVDDVHIIICIALKHLHVAMSASEHIEDPGLWGGELTKSLRSIRTELTSCLDDYVDNLGLEILRMRNYIEQQQETTHRA